MFFLGFLSLKVAIMMLLCVTDIFFALCWHDSFKCFCNSSTEEPSRRLHLIFLEIRTLDSHCWLRANCKFKGLLGQWIDGECARFVFFVATRDFTWCGCRWANDALQDELLSCLKLVSDFYYTLHLLSYLVCISVSVSDRLLNGSLFFPWPR